MTAIRAVALSKTCLRLTPVRSRADIDASLDQTI